MRVILLLCGLLATQAFAGDEYKQTQGYKGYLKLPESYRSPAAEALFRDGYEAEEKVKNLASIHGGTVGERLDQKASVPAVDDLGWITSQLNGIFYVQRMMLLGNMKLDYRWEVGRDGTVRATNGKAIGITK